MPVTPFADLPIVDETWTEAGETKNSVLTEVLGDPPDWDKFAKAHIWRESTGADTRAAYKLPIARMRDGRLTAYWSQVVAAYAAIQGARGGIDIPNEDKGAAINHLAKYYRKFDKEPPPASKTAKLKGAIDMCLKKLRLIQSPPPPPPKTFAGIELTTTAKGFALAGFDVELGPSDDSKWAFWTSLEDGSTTLALGYETAKQALTIAKSVTAIAVPMASIVRAATSGQTEVTKSLLDSWSPQLVSEMPARQVPILKLQEETRTIVGVVLEPEEVDGHGDVYSADEIRKTAHQYLIHYRNIALQHKAYRNDVLKVVESYIVDEDGTRYGEKVKAGTWIIKVQVDDDEIWADVLKGAYTGFSIAGFATRIPIAA